MAISSKTKNKKRNTCPAVEKKAKNLGEMQRALMNILEDAEEARKKAEEERGKTVSIVKNLSDGILVFDSKGNIYLSNPQAGKFLGMETKDFIGKKIQDLKKEERAGALVEVLKKETGGIFRKEIVIDKNLILEVSTVPMIIGGSEFGIIVVLHDITREKTIERMKTEFVSLAAHQLRTPLAAIKWTIKMLLEGDAGEISSSQKDLLDKTYQSNERMITLINDLLDVTRIEEGRFLYKPSMASLEDVAEFVIKSKKDELEIKGVSLDFKKSKEKIPRVIMDVEKIRLVIQNLLENAMKYTPKGGKITVSLKGDSKKIELQVKDTGVGIPKDQQDKIFSKFFRGSNIIRVETEGSGLGLFISKNIIDAHGGKIWFESEEGEGSIFYFSLPVKKELEEFLKEF